MVALSHVAATRCMLLRDSATTTALGDAQVAAIELAALWGAPPSIDVAAFTAAHPTVRRATVPATVDDMCTATPPARRGVGCQRHLRELASDQTPCRSMAPSHSPLLFEPVGLPADSPLDGPLELGRDDELNDDAAA